MPTNAAGAYIRTLREKRNLTREVIADRAGTSVSQLVRIESGEQETRGSLLLRIVAAVDGDARHIAELLLSETATSDDGRDLAETVLRVLDEEGARPYLKTPEDVAELMSYVEEEMTAIREEDRRSLSEALRGFLAGFRAGRRRGGDSRA
jgi:transcriptional regulator with XRE-family HTH domain